MVSDAVYMFLKWLMTTDLPDEDEPIEDKRYLLMIKTCIGKFVQSVRSVVHRVTWKTENSKAYRISHCCETLNQQQTAGNNVK